MPESEQAPELSFDTLYKDLGQLRSYGLRPPIKKGTVPTLLALAHKLAAERDTTAADQITTGTANERHQAAAEQIRTIIETAAEQLDGGRNEAVAELFALAMPTPTPDLPTRRSAAAKKVRCAPSTFERYRERPLLEALATRLLDLYGGNGSITESEDIGPPLSSGDPKDIARGPVSPLTAAKKRTVIAALAALVMVLAVVAWALWPTAQTSSVPPPGSVVNTWTGQASLHVPVRLPSPYGDAQIDGGDIFRGCNITVESYCNNPPYSNKLNARHGDLIHLKVRLYNSGPEPISYLKMDVSYGTGKNTSILQVDALIQWPVRPNDVAGETIQALVDIKLPTAGNYRLDYVPGSTTLTGIPPQSFQYHLPDGILGAGIALSNIGGPAGCFECDLAYTRIVNFYARVE